MAGFLEQSGRRGLRPAAAACCASGRGLPAAEHTHQALVLNALAHNLCFKTRRPEASLLGNRSASPPSGAASEHGRRLPVLSESSTFPAKREGKAGPLAWSPGLPVAYVTCPFLSRQTLCLRQNLIKCIENLEALQSLRELDLYDNQIRKIENLEALTELE